ISAAFAFELIVGHIAHATTTAPAIDPQIKFAHGVLGDFHLGGQELLVIGVMIVPALLIYFGVFLDTLKK
ncbi:hypothetical protein CBG25_02050, partial [Arsenophonus sp. ENCA]|uniref:hypothetical protein n=1 Tax=Arsenophonus sp. ENCA TaxID=1987579 RepID=UPI000BC4A25E